MTIPLNNLATFISIVKNQKLKKAADELSITESAVSHQLSRLEERLQVKLLNRSSKGMNLTVDGKIFYEQIAPAIAQIDKALSQLQNPNEKKLVITMPQSFAAMWFSQRLHHLELEFPDVEFEIRPTQRVCNLEEEGIDIGIRTSPEIPKTETATILFQELLTPVCAEKTFTRIKRLTFEDSLLKEGIILNDIHQDEWSAWCKEHNYKIPDKVKVRNMSTFDLVSNTVLHGNGLAMGRTPLINYHLEMGWLVEPYPNKLIQGPWYYTETNSKKRKSKLSDDFINWLVSEFKSDFLS